MKKQIIIAIVLIAAIAGIATMGIKKKQDAIATVGKVVIKQAQLDERLATYPKEYAEALKEKENRVKILDQMINEEILLLAARDAGYMKDPSFKKELELNKNQLLLNRLIDDQVNSKVTVSEEEAQAYYSQNPQIFGKLENRRAQHILVKTQKEAQQLRARALKGANFAQLAKEHSIDPSAKNGGDLGWFQRGQLVPEFEQAVFALKKDGDISKVVQTQFGYHVIRLLGQKNRPPLQYDQVRQKIYETIVLERRQAKTDTYIKKLKSKYPVTRNVSKIK